MGRTEARLGQLGLTLPRVAESQAAYVPAVRVGSFVWTSGQLPLVEGVLAEKGTVGYNLGQVAPPRAQELASLCALNALAVAAAEVGTLDRVVRVVKVLGFVASEPTFLEHSFVLDGFSNQLADVLEDRGRHARSAIGVAGLPLGSPLEVEVVFEVE